MEKNNMEEMEETVEVEENLSETVSEHHRKFDRNFLQGFFWGALIFCILTFAVSAGIYCLITYNSKEYKIDKLIDEHYMGDVDEEALEDGKYSGMIEGLGDTYSRYFSADDYAEYKQSASGTFVGIGVVIVKDDEGSVLIYGIYTDSPADKAGLEAGDTILKVNGLNASDYELDEISQMISDSENVDFVIKKYETGEEVEVTVEPGEIDVPTVSSSMYDGNVGVIVITQFADVTSDQFAEAYQSLKDQNMEYLIVDLRDNGGGYMTSVIDILSQFVPEGLLVYTEDKNGERQDYTSDCTDPIDIPVAVLVNGQTASASEIFCGAVRDRGVGILVGEKTFGKGIVQNTYEVGDGSYVKLTIKKYYTPDGINFHGVGLEPDVEVEPDENATTTDDENDNQFLAAVEAVKELNK